MDIKYVVLKMRSINDLINAGSFDSAYKIVKELLKGLDDLNTISKNRIIILSNLAGNLIDIGSFSNKKV